MGFFSDLKEDINQSIDEMAPAADAQEEASQQTAFGESASAEEDAKASLSADDLTAMLDQVDSTVPVAEPEEPAAAEESVPAYSGKSEISNDIHRAMGSDEVSTICAGMNIKGNLKADGSLDLFGGLVGNIDIKGKLNVTGTIEGDSHAAEIFADDAKITGELISEGAIKIGQNSIIIGNIAATSAVIAGAVKGDIDVHGPVILDTTAIVMGNIKSKSVQINNGAVIEGLCSQTYADVSPTSFFDNIVPKKSGKKNN
ncbi:MAG: polymer-forming cytoskeletal protein [Lachnospiraceae bacterium]|nr:polymer-forming cytoskeletal protein [Lachnospiraceae bacterium]